MLPESRHWNHNIHYHRTILSAVPQGARSALDVGCGEGSLCRAMRNRIPDVVGIDIDPTGIAMAEAAGGDIRYVLSDFMSYEFAPRSFDFIASVATLHHLDLRQVLARFQELLRPGGVLAVVGLARRAPADLPYDALGFVAHRLLRLRHGYWEHPSPVADPTMTHRELRSVIRTLLPEAEYRQHILFRYSLVWTKPAGTVPSGRSTSRNAQHRQQNQHEGRRGE